MAEPESEPIKKYFQQINDNTVQLYEIAKAARKKGLDPEGDVDILLAKNMAERVEGLISSVAPQLKGSMLTKRIHELEQKYGNLAWEVALIVAEEVANEKFCNFKNKVEAMEVGIRTGFAYHTLGIVAAPLEGFIELKLKRRRDNNKEYFALKFAGPVRGAGGTGASVCVLIGDYVRKKMGYASYDPSEEEISRFITELDDYHERVTNLQYHPTSKELKFLISRIPVEIDGDPTEDIEVSNYKDLPRVETNRVRSGVCLVVSMLALKAPKLWKRLEKWGKGFDLDWDFLKEFLSIQKKAKAQSKEQKSDSKKLVPNTVYITDLVAGRPVLSYPLTVGGFRLRYGRSRLSGFSAASIHPSTSRLLNDYIATGTQLKVERPGKAAAITFADTLEPPIVKLNDDSVLKLDKEEQAKRLSKDVKEILFLGDILFNYGDFSENNHFLVPAGYNEEWYVLELEKAMMDMFGSFDLEKLSLRVSIPKNMLEVMMKNPQTTKISASAAISIAEKLSVPLHPAYTYYWSTISSEEFFELVNWLSSANIIKKGSVRKIILRIEEKPKRVLELLGIPHIVVVEEWAVIDRQNSIALLATLGLKTKEDAKKLFSKKDELKNESVLEILKKIALIQLRDKAGTFIGARMGRPEKAKQRKMTGSPHSLFPVGEEGGRLRSIQSALEAGKITGQFPIFFCENCRRETIYSVCEECSSKTKKQYYCNSCGVIDVEICPRHGKALHYRQKSIDIKHHMDRTLKQLSTKVYPDLIKGVRGTSNKNHIPENLVKGVLRAKHNVYVNKDGTTRYDMSEVPMTHFKPKEIGTSVEKLIELGYLFDIHKQPLVSEDQVLELKPQDIVLPGGQMIDESAEIVMFNVGNFIDELLKKFYGLKSFYNFRTPKDIAGHLVIGIAPHISAGLIGRIIGFSGTQGCFAHPLWHAGLRRDCDGDEACIMLALDGLINFSRQFLPDTRGAKTMDAPLVLTSKLVPSEVDDMVHGLDVVTKYPLSFYEATLEYKNPREAKVEQLKSRLGSELQYEGYGFTHDSSDMNMGVTCSAYKTLPSMEEKLRGQMNLAEKIRAVDQSGVAALVIEKHFLKDTKGNLRKFSQQQFRCVKCNEKFRRPPLSGVCSKCGGKLIFTISEGSVVKYLEPSISLANKYNVPPYLKQTLELTKKRIEGFFGKDKEKQEGLGKWFG
ncbi:DNA polymerase II large subunit [Candidatus Woesearchaeota archaeon]|nr:DNA polymerase II large subunit [Candidatus Woesearchaeota archaeon]